MNRLTNPIEATNGKTTPEISGCLERYLARKCSVLYTPTIRR